MGTSQTCIHDKKKGISALGVTMWLGAGRGCENMSGVPTAKWSIVRRAAVDPAVGVEPTRPRYAERDRGRLREETGGGSRGEAKGEEQGQR